ncbi:MAG: hypothetical protein ACLFRI_01195 [Candidatus Izemoplasmataceae bacterium]
MRLEEAIKRTKKLIKNGRYQTYHVKHFDAFKTVDSVDHAIIDGVEYMPFFHHTTNQLVYGYHEQVNGNVFFHYIAFSKFDYFYGADDHFLWVDHDEDFFDDL